MRKILFALACVASVTTTAALSQTPPQTLPQTPPAPPPGGMMRGDPDGDRTITRADYIAQAEARFAAMDTNRDGKLTIDERRAARQAMRDGMRGRMRGTGDMPPPPPIQPRPVN